MESESLMGMYVYLDIVRDFSCRQCGTCCRNDWLVTVDEAGFRRNRKLFDAAGRAEEFEQAFIPIGREADVGEFAAIAKQPSGGCWFLTEQNLCRLQQLAGHEHLDAVCQCFPRYPMDTERGIEFSLSFSCPEAVRLATREEPLQVVRGSESPLAGFPADFVRHVYPSRQPLQSIWRYYFEIEGHLIELLQARVFSLAERLQMLRHTLQQMEEWQESEEFGDRLNQLFAANYAQMDDASAVRNTVSRTLAECLVENVFVNFLFRKNLYVEGFRQTLQQIGRMEEELMGFAADEESRAGIGELAKRIVAMELAWNHHRRNK